MSTCILLESGIRGGSAAELVRASASRLGIKVSSGDAAVEAGRSITESLTHAIRDADFVVAVVSGRTSAQSWFEVGLAAAVGRSLLLVLDGVEPGELPATGQFRTVGPVLVPEALDRAMRRAAKPRPPSTGRVSETGRVLSSDQWQRLSNTLSEELKVTPAGGADGARFEAWFAELLADVDLPYTSSARVPKAENAPSYDNVDFAISASELGPNLGDPLPIELVLGSPRRVLRSRADSFDKYLAATGATTLLVVTLSSEPLGIRELTNGEVLWVPASRLLHELRSHTFGQAVLAMRSLALNQSAGG